MSGIGTIGFEAMRKAAEQVLADNPNAFSDSHLMAVMVCYLLDRRATEIEPLRDALERVSEQVPENIGNEPYVISPDALYAVRLALRDSYAREEA